MITFTEQIDKTIITHNHERYSWMWIQSAIKNEQWAISNNGCLSDSLYKKKIWEDLVFNNALPKSLTIAQVACLEAKPKLHNGMVYRQFIKIPVVLIDATNYVYKCITT